MTQEKLNKNKNQPEETYRVGSVSATIWANPKTINGQEVTIRSVVIERNYKDKDGNWKSTNQFGINDLPRVTLASELAFQHLVCGGKDDEN